ncbi:tyrosine-type recombinase/integrase [Symbiobacterium terraclitae]|uniref:tyrosine-type recombinase/integrase n=1 Tax=Symbiobacterium terraclitae TaxID=557451 RepID=UPI0035B555C3
MGAESGRSYGVARDVTAHDLRKTFATHQFYHCDTDLLRLQRWLGHADINTTRSYVDDLAGWQRRQTVRDMVA